MAQVDIKQVRGDSPGSVLFLGTNSNITEDSKLRWIDDVLTLQGNIKIIDGNQQQGWVLSTDNDGLSTWVDPLSLGVTGPTGPIGQMGPTGATGIASQSLSETLVIGNTSGGNDIIMSDNDSIFSERISSKKSSSSLRFDLSDENTIELTTDDGAYDEDSSWVFGMSGNSTQIGYQISSTESIGFGIYASGISPLINTAKEIVIGDNRVVDVYSGDIDKRAVFIGTRNSEFNSGVVNSVILGGSGITATANNTIYVPNLIAAGSITISPTTTTGQLNIGSSTNRLYRDNTNDLTLAQQTSSAAALYLDSIGDVTVAIDSNNNQTGKFFRVIKDASKSGTELFRVQENGNVGVGITDPKHKLHVLNDVRITRAQSNNDISTTNFHTGLYFGNNLQYAGSDDPILSTNTSYIDGVGTSNRGGTLLFNRANSNTLRGLYFYTAPDSTGAGDPVTLTQQFRVNVSNAFINVDTGINQTSPTGVLTVKGRTTSSGHTIFNAQNSAGDINIFDVRGSGVCYINGNSGTSQLRFRRLNAATNGTKGVLSAFDVDDYVVACVQFAAGASSDNSGQILFRTSPSSSETGFSSIPERMRIDVDGNVGIARANPTEKLDVVGNVKISNLLKLTGVASDPGSPENGDIWHNTTANEIRVRLNGVTLKLDTSSI
jgi:hypothetical protein